MHFHKYPYPENFEYPERIAAGGAFKTRKGSFRIAARSGANDIYHLQVTGKGWQTNESHAGLRFPKPKSTLEGKQTRLVLARDNTLRLETRDGAPILATPSAKFFGQCGPASIFRFIREKGDQFYGMGEKWLGFEHSGRNTKFWNTDVWADFHPEAYLRGYPDPTYLSIPYLIIRRRGVFIGLLLDNPYATYLSTSSSVSIANQMDVTLSQTQETLHLGCEEGQPNLYILFGPTLAELTRKLQRLVGTTPLPPAWALGYHQCRWGYDSEADLSELDVRFREPGIPCDGLWLDIGYMDAYKVFTFSKEYFPHPARAMSRFAKAGRKVVPIIDPGVKLQPGYPVYERGKKAAAFCETPQGTDYVGLVWPGETVFPDFSIPECRKWWANEVAAFAKHGIHGAWLDMNDPATGRVENEDMLFDHGRKSHSSYHNQYALGMAIASRDGFLKAHPNERPFLLSRSGFTGSNRYTAVWTGDNYSNYHHLKNSIPTTLNLALSGLPFNGPDAGGFGGDTTPQLILDWFKAGFLFPFFRNHAVKGSRQQEPWTFGKETLPRLRRYIQLRYRFRPYLYQLYAEHERTGEAILRPLFYDFEETPALPLGLVDDQFLVGPSVMQAPFLVERQILREVTLPGVTRWYSVADDTWLAGSQKVTVRSNPDTTPIYIRENTILPLARLDPADHAFHAERADFHIFIPADGQSATIPYVFDDGATFAYKKGKRSEAVLTATRAGDSLAIELTLRSAGYGKGEFTFTTYTGVKRVTVNGVRAKKAKSQGIPIGPAATVTWEAPKRAVA